MVAHNFLPQVLERQRQVELCEFKARLVYRVSSRTVRAAQGNPVSKKEKQCQVVMQTDVKLRYQTILQKGYPLLFYSANYKGIYLRLST